MPLLYPWAMQRSKTDLPLGDYFAWEFTTTLLGEGKNRQSITVIVHLL